MAKRASRQLRLWFQLELWPELDRTDPSDAHPADCRGCPDCQGIGRVHCPLPNCCKPDLQLELVTSEARKLLEAEGRDATRLAALEGTGGESPHEPTPVTHAERPPRAARRLSAPKRRGGGSPPGCTAQGHRPAPSQACRSRRSR